MRESTPAWHVGETVQTPFGKGVVREVRSNGRVLVQVRARTLVLPTEALSRTNVSPRPAKAVAGHSVPVAPVSQTGGAARSPVVIDLHGLTVEEALGRVDLSLNEALLADVPEVRFIHGRSGGRIRAALHRHLRGIPTVRRFRVDPHNAGVTIVEL